MPSEPFLKSIREEANSELDLEAQTGAESDSLFSHESYKSFTPHDWVQYAGKVVVILCILGLVCFLVYIGIYTLIKQ
jgi:hypothetical protein